MYVLKFGGTSVATARRRQTVAEIVAAKHREHSVVVVTSALAGVTDGLLEAIARAVAGEDVVRRREHLDHLRRLHLADLSQPALPHRRPLVDAIEAMFTELGRCLDGLALLGDCPNSTRHRLLAFGERLALPLLVAALEDHGLSAVAVDGSELLVTEDAHGAPVGGATRVDRQASRQRVEAWRQRMDARQVTVVSGFVAADGEGRTTTLGRGASDLTATLLAAFLEAQGVEIWSDVDGVLSASPHWVEAPRRLPYLSYGEAAEMAHFGARVLHPRTFEPLLSTAIPVYIHNTMNPHGDGTCIGPGQAAPWQAECSEQGSIRAITARRNHALLRLRGHGSGFHRQLYETLDALQLEPLLLQHGSGGRSVALVIPEASAAAACRALRRRLPRAAECDVELECRSGVGLVAAIGDGAEPIAAVGRMLDSLRRCGVAGLALAMPCQAGHSDERAMTVLVDDNDVPRAVRQLHRELVETEAVPYKAPLRRAHIKQEPLSRLL